MLKSFYLLFGLSCVLCCVFRLLGGLGFCCCCFVCCRWLLFCFNLVWVFLHYIIFPRTKLLVAKFVGWLLFVAFYLHHALELKEGNRFLNSSLQIVFQISKTTLLVTSKMESNTSICKTVKCLLVRADKYLAGTWLWGAF